MPDPIPWPGTFLAQPADTRPPIDPAVTRLLEAGLDAYRQVRLRFRTDELARYFGQPDPQHAERLAEEDVDNLANWGRKDPGGAIYDCAAAAQQLGLIELEAQLRLQAEAADRELYDDSVPQS